MNQFLLIPVGTLQESRGPGFNGKLDILVPSGLSFVGVRLGSGHSLDLKVGQSGEATEDKSMH